MKRSLQEIAEAVEARLRGDGKVEIEGVASIGSASKHDLVFVEEEKYLARAMQSGAGAVIAGEFAAAASGKPLLISRHPKLAFARAARFLRDGNRDGNNAGVHPTAVVHKSVRLARVWWSGNMPSWGRMRKSGRARGSAPVARLREE